MYQRGPTVMLLVINTICLFLAFCTLLYTTFPANLAVWFLLLVVLGLADEQ
jgi:hypothetical protein